jgi:predicted nucleic acid-binding protein
MKVVLDTNVLIAGIFFSGLPARILGSWADGGFELVASVEVLAEYRRVAERLHRRFSSIDINPILDLVTRETGQSRTRRRTRRSLDSITTRVYTDFITLSFVDR